MDRYQEPIVADRATLSSYLRAFGAADLGRFGLYVFAFSVWLSTAAAQVGLALMLIGSAADRTKRTALLRDPVLGIAVLLAVYVVLQTLVIDPSNLVELTTSPGTDFWLWTKPLLFLPLAAQWLRGDERRIGLVMALAVAGLMVRMVVEGHERGFALLLAGHRFGFGLNPIMFAMFAGTALLWFIVFAPRILTYARSRGGRIAVTAAWGLALAVLAQGLVIAQTRNSWMGIVILYPLCLAAMLIMLPRAARRWSRVRISAVSLMVVILTATIVASNWSTIVQRTLSESTTWEKIFIGDIEGITTSNSLALHLRLWQLGFDKWLERPLLGWGIQGAVEQIQHSGDAELALASHVHNTYIEVLFEIGAVGAVILVIAGLVIGRVMYAAVRSRRMSIDYAIFFIGAAGLLLLSAVSDFMVWSVIWKMHFAMLGAMVYGFRYREAAPVPLTHSPANRS